MQETICSRCDEVTTSSENLCAGLSLKKTCNDATLIKLSSITGFLNGCACAGTTQTATFVKLQSKLIIGQRSCNPTTVTIELFASTVNG